MRAGSEMLTPARALLARLLSPLLTVCRGRDDGAEVVRLFAWTDMLEPGDEIGAGSELAGPEQIAIQIAGAQALREVAVRWPPYAMPPVVGLVTDGIGLAISGEHPCGLSRQWLIDQLERGSPASVIIPFDPSGVWALLSNSRCGQPLPARN
jgi:hypothetical protein